MWYWGKAGSMELVQEAFSVLEEVLQSVFVLSERFSWEISFFLGAFLLREETFPMSTIHWGNCLSLGALELITFPITLLSRRPWVFFLV